MTNILYSILSKPESIKRTIRQLNQKINDTRLMMLPRAIQYDNEKVMSSPSDPMLKYAEKIDEYIQQKDKLDAEYLLARERVYELVDKLNNDDMKDIIIARYIDCISLYKMETYINMSKSKIYKLYSKSISILEKIIVEENGKKSVIY